MSGREDAAGRAHRPARRGGERTARRGTGSARVARVATPSAGALHAQLVRISRRLAREVGSLAFTPPVRHVYNPLDYARQPHERYLACARPAPDVLLVGMNPGPFGMAQTGVPFGEVAAVRDFLGITGRVTAPPDCHVRRPVLGFDCPRSEVSGARLWGWARGRFGDRGRLFSHLFVWNWCPLAFVEESGRNRTPDKLPAHERAPLEVGCDRALRDVVRCLAPRTVVGVGAFAEARARCALAGLDVPIGRILHPSPASPLANRGWAEAVDRELEQLGVRF